ncbi:SET domain-containing protein-lysine N-methyltransferase [Vibrio aestuarianus]|uniref:SET domain-containing protein-lysine N-methyltransferase n=1 Tax=Vibrio aestuarianus TaxID=28171 RepID=UPI00237CF43E|nr:SET domain-containing protein-lysine N-methyltransferase [Vibrio aestuarianus]MDE1254452.1 SET domain-containing protein-lysine N-methyltransferase [Vibrio aestuarianus]
MFASPISAEKKTHKDVEGEKTCPSFTVQKVSHSPCRGLPTFLQPSSTKLADQDRNTEREGRARQSTWIQSYLAGMTIATPRRVNTDQQSLVNIGIEERHISKIRGNNVSSNILKKLENLTLEQQQQLKDLGIVGDTLSNLVNGAGSGSKDLKNLNAVLGITPEQKEKLSNFGITSDKLVKVLEHYGGSTSLEVLLNLTPEQEKTLNDLRVVGDKFVSIVKCGGGSRNIQALLTLTQEQKETLNNLGITAANDLVRVVGHGGGSKSLQAVLALSPEQKEKLHDLGIAVDDLVRIAGRSGGSKNLQSLLDLQPEQKEKLINLGITGKNLVCIVGQFGGSKTLQALFTLTPEEKETLKDLGITTVDDLVRVVGHDGGSKTLQSLLDLQPEQREKLINLEITADVLVRTVGRPGGSKSLQSLLALQPEQEKKLINLGLTADNLVRIVRRGGGSSTLPIVLALTPEQEKKLNDFEITKDLLVNVVRTTNRAKNLRALLEITPEQKEELDKLEITSGELVSVVEHGGDKNLKALLGHLPNLDKRYTHQAVRLLNQNDAHASFSNQYQAMIKQDRLQDGGDGQRASVIRWAVPQTPPILQVRTVDQRGSVIVARDSVIVKNMARLNVQSKPSTTHMEVKQEPSFESEDEVCFDSHQPRKKPCIDNGAPILRKSTNPSQSAIALTEDSIKSLSVAQYGAELKKALNSVSNVGKRSETKSAIAGQCKDFLKKSMEGQHAAWINSWADTAVPVDDGPLRGQSVFAKRDIKEFEVLGAYSGILHEDERSLASVIRKKGSVPVLTYLWSTQSKKRNIDASQYANSLAAINTAHLPSNKPQEIFAKHNNLDCVRFGPNYVFYVALRDIKQGEELLIDYGADYDPLQIKKESMDDSIN